MSFEVKCGNKVLDLSTPVIMGILNATPDSFSDGGQFHTYETACKHAEEMISQGARIIDVGGESTRPNAPKVSLEEELARVIPVIKHLSKKDILISVDTSKAEVMKQAIAAGAHIINDVRALQEPQALEMAASLNVPVCIMHMQGTPQTMQVKPKYQNIIEEISNFFEVRIQACLRAGIKKDHIILDPGFGFGKTLEHNLQLLAQQDEFHKLGCPILIGLSRKSMFAQLLNRDVSERLAGSLAGALISSQKGAHIIRVHDVQETFDALETNRAIQKFL
ncbi:dihydropteroate synthase [Parashewanella spongiae]|uniref:Dihydropteroate synthase n=1 Tax=Parashewanella spongiae TaxID=342950 RepID=A0A3A6U3Z6_9GAMM|nr:dihydropteroate synthase [Parashewanella spongiae]MCL1079045.1 dihydropteroate synthase [Parashewanella spongiae]RJY10802.1 dihydropteroate synthase [Parashewanella spongiae]